MSCFSIKQATSGILCGSSSVINQTPKSASVPSCRTLHLTVLAKGFNKNQLAITNLNDRNTFFRIVTVVKCIISCNSLEVAFIPLSISYLRYVGWLIAIHISHSIYHLFALI